MLKEVMNDLWLARISSLSNEVGWYVVLLEVTLACMSCQGRCALESYKTKLNKRKKAFTTTKTRNINLQNKFNFHVSGASKRIFVTIKSTIDAVKFQIV
jgi:hypothetical protein